MKNFIQTGDSVTVPAPANVESGDGVLVGDMFGVAIIDADSGDDVSLQLTGVVELPKTAAEAWTVGASVYWDGAEDEATTVSTDNTLIGVAVKAADNPSDYGKVRLNGSF